MKARSIVLKVRWGHRPYILLLFCFLPYNFYTLPKRRVVAFTKTIDVGYLFKYFRETVPKETLFCEMYATYMDNSLQTAIIGVQNHC